MEKSLLWLFQDNSCSSVRNADNANKAHVNPETPKSYDEGVVISEAD